MTDFLHKLNPFYKFVLIGLIATGLTFVHSFTINIWVFGISIALLIIGTKPKTWWRALKIFTPLAVIGFGIFMSGLLWGDAHTSEFGTITHVSTQTGFNMLSRFFSFAGLGLLISLTTDSFEFVKSLQKDGRLSRKFAYGMMAAINLIPHMKSEYQNARLAFAVRGAHVGPLSTKVIFAMLVNCFRWSEMLAIAMHSKGFYE